MTDTMVDGESADARRVLLRTRALCTDAHGCVTPVHDQPWHELSSGSYRLVDHFMTEQRCYALLQTGLRPTPTTKRQTEWLERVLRADSQKGAALDLRIAQSTLASGLRHYLNDLGVSSRPSKIPLSLILIARATDQAQRGAVWRESTFTHGDAIYRVVSWSRPDTAIARILSPAECSVVRLVIEGLSHAEIASRRRTSMRTVANQLASAFRRLNVSGRLQLCRYVVDLTEADAITVS